MTLMTLMGSWVLEAPRAGPEKTFATPPGRYDEMKPASSAGSVPGV
jgi:hypothetical protein